jgi:hypothetical protein
MPPDERRERVRLLREQGQTPKQIARALGIRSAEAARLVRETAIAAQATAPEPAVAGCWINPSWSAGLTIRDHPDWALHEDPDAGTDGLASVLVARQHRYGKVSVCGYLADLYCLGVKNALGPKVMDDVRLTGFVRDFFSSHDADPLEVPIELAREVVFGSVEYARGLGFDPHPDFADARGHLGPWTGPSTITFGKDGKPLYISGPHDDPSLIIRTLEHAVGRGNFDFLAVAH